MRGNFGQKGCGNTYPKWQYDFPEVANKGYGREDILHSNIQNEMMTTSDTIKNGSLQTFLDAASTKFDKGQQEHGGLLTDRDCFMEMQKEIIDQWHYWYAENMRRQKQAQYIQELESEIVRLQSLLGGSVPITPDERMATLSMGAVA